MAQGRVADIPIPIDIARAWCTGEGLEEPDLRRALRGDLEALPIALRAVEVSWGGSEYAIPSALLPALRDALAVARVRRARLERDYVPPDGERQNIFYEVHQGARRPETMDRYEHLQKLNALFERHSSLDSSVLACVCIDRAAECEAKGLHDETLTHLGEADELLRGNDDPDLAEYGRVCLAQHAWASGEPNGALEMLANLTTERARDLRTRIESREAERKALRKAERVHRRHAELKTWCDLAPAHLVAGHTIAAERTADEICRAYPAKPLAWDTKARVLHGMARHRDAVAAARTALAVGDDRPTANALLARILNRLGRETREEAVASAEDAIDGLVGRMDSSSADLSMLADMVHRLGGSIESARTADGFIWRHRREQEPPAEWLGAAAARRCHGEWSLDAVRWLARLAHEGQPEDLARFVTDRVEYLQYLRLDPATRVFGSCPTYEEEGALHHVAGEVLRRTHGHSLRVEGARLAMLAASSLRVPADEAREALALGDEEIAALEEAARPGLDPSLASVLRFAGGPTIAASSRRSSAWSSRYAFGRASSRSGPSRGFTRRARTRWRHSSVWRRSRGRSVRGSNAFPPQRDLVRGGEGELRPGTRQRLERLLRMALLDEDGVSRFVWRTTWRDLREE